jgi:hypothetical protein
VISERNQLAWGKDALETDLVIARQERDAWKESAEEQVTLLNQIANERDALKAELELLKERDTILLDHYVNKCVQAKTASLKGELEVARAWLHEADAADKQLRKELAELREAKPSQEPVGYTSLDWIDLKGNGTIVKKPSGKWTHPVYAAPQDKLRKAAQAVVDRWDTPLWKDVPATAEYINTLRMDRVL